MSGEEGAESPASVELPPACMDLTDFPPKIDFFDNMQLLDEKAEKIEGAINLRQVNGFPVFGTGQTTEEGFLKVLEKVKSIHGEEGEKLIWFNMRKVCFLSCSKQSCKTNWKDIQTFNNHRSLLSTSMANPLLPATPRTSTVTWTSRTPLRSSTT